ncbi:hypothetical protein Hanom_Chr15g01412461 [Helianthus anomalus]
MVTKTVLLSLLFNLMNLTDTSRQKKTQILKSFMFDGDMKLLNIKNPCIIPRVNL